MEPTQTYNNQVVLIEIGQMIGDNYGVKPEPKKSSLWSQIAYYFPTQETAGKIIDEHIVQTHGQKWSNQTIDVERKKEGGGVVFLSNWFKSAEDSVVAEELKLDL